MDEHVILVYEVIVLKLPLKLILFSGNITCDSSELTSNIKKSKFFSLFTITLAKWQIIQQFNKRTIATYFMDYVNPQNK